MRVLIIDDSRAARMAVVRIMKDLQYDTVEAENGEEAILKLQTEGPFDLAMVDWNMPVMSGYDFVKAVRKNSKYSNLVLIMVTTENEMSQVVKAISAGANEYIMKPFTDEVVLEKLEILGLR